MSALARRPLRKIVNASACTLLFATAAIGLTAAPAW